MIIEDSLKIYKFHQEPFVSSFKLKTENNPILLFPEQKKTDSDTFTPSITPKGITDKSALKDAPNPNITIAGEKKKAGIVVDISKNILYRYDKDGNPVNAYLIASGKKSTPTDKGVRIVTHNEKFPYKTANGTKRKRSPKDYGPFVIILKKIDTKTGEQTRTGEFIHGCRNYQDTFETDPGRYVSKGCMRMDNDVIKELASNVERGEIVIIK